MISDVSGLRVSLMKLFARTRVVTGEIVFGLLRVAAGQIVSVLFQSCHRRDCVWPASS